MPPKKTTERNDIDVYVEQQKGHFGGGFRILFIKLLCVLYLYLYDSNPDQLVLLVFYMLFFAMVFDFFFSYLFLFIGKGEPNATNFEAVWTLFRNKMLHMLDMVILIPMNMKKEPKSKHNIAPCDLWHYAERKRAANLAFEKHLNWIPGIWTIHRNAQNYAISAPSRISGKIFVRVSARCLILCSRNNTN